jgi:hypothetical protein
MRSVVVAMVAFAAMEPITAATHRFVMHGVGRRLHRSHHAPNPHGWELNDLYPDSACSCRCVSAQPSTEGRMPQCTTSTFIAVLAHSEAGELRCSNVWRLHTASIT